MKRIFSNTCNILAVVMLSAATLSSCSEGEQLGQPDAIAPEAMAETTAPQSALTPEQQLMKQNLDAAAQQLLTLVNTCNVRNELYQLDYDRIKTDRLRISELMEQPSKGGAFGALATGIARTFEAGAKGGNAELLDYLKAQGCEIHLPYPLDWYPADAPITVAGHPIDNVVEGEGYVIDMASGLTKRVLVNDEYADTNPVLIVQPMHYAPIVEDRRYELDDVICIDPDWGGGGGSGGGSSSGSGSSSSASSSYTTTVSNRAHIQDVEGKRFKAKIGEVFCSMKPNLFEGVVELRMEVVPLGSSDPISLIEIDIPKAYVKSAYKGWSHSNGGWYDKKKCDLLTNWTPEIAAIGILAYDYDPEKSWSGGIGFGVTVMGNGGNFSYSKQSNKYSGDLFGKVLWGRTDFIDLNANPPAIDEVRDGWLVWTIGGNLKFTIEWCWY